MASVRLPTSLARLGRSPSARRTFAPPRACPSHSAARFQVSAFKVTLNMPDSTQTFDVDADTNIMVAAEKAGVKLPYACHGGACGACVGNFSNYALQATRSKLPV